MSIVIDVTIVNLRITRRYFLQKGKQQIFYYREI
jgi:hypothetical protein